MIVISSLWKWYLFIFIFVVILFQYYLNASLTSSKSQSSNILLESHSFYQVEIHQKIYLVNRERNRLYYFDTVEGPVLIAAASSNVKQLTLLQRSEVLNAPFQEITDVTGDLDGNLYISDCKANKIYKLRPSTTNAANSSRTIIPQFTAEIFATNEETDLSSPETNGISCPYGLHYLEFPSKERHQLEEGLYFINQRSCQIRFISKKMGILEILYTVNGPCSSKMTFLTVFLSTQTMYYLTEHPTKIHKLQLLTGLEYQKDLFLSESLLEDEYRERFDVILEKLGEEERNGFFLIQRYLLSKIHSTSLPPPPSVFTHSNPSDPFHLIYSTSRRRLQTVTLLLDFAFSPSDLGTTPSTSATVANHGTLSVSGSLRGISSTPATCIDLPWKAGYTSALSLNKDFNQSMAFTSSFYLPTTGMSFAFWYRCNSCASNTKVFDFGTTSLNYQVSYKINTGAVVSQTISSSLYTTTINTPSSDCNQGQWCFIVWTMTSASQTLQTSTHVIYLNGTQYSTVTGYYPVSSVPRGANYIGASNGGSASAGPYCTMLIGRFQLYNSVLTASQVLNLYNSGALPTAPPTLYPTLSPTFQPTLPAPPPSGLPSSQPSGQPTTGPTSLPSSQSSSDPTFRPSGKRSAQPTSMPSTLLTSQPTSRLSGQKNTLGPMNPTSQPTSQPSSIFDDIDRQNSLYVTNYAGTGIIGTLRENMTATTAEINAHCIWIDSIGNIYIAGDPKIWVMNVHHYINTFVGGATAISMPSGPDDRVSLTSLSVHQPLDLWGDSNGNLYLIQSQVVLKISNGTAILFAGGGSNSPDYTEQDATDVSLNAPTRLWGDTEGSLYITDTINNYVYRIELPAVRLSIYAGTGYFSTGNLTSGGAATDCDLSGPYAITGDSDGNIYFSEIYNNIIRRVSSSDASITIYAGTGSSTPSTTPLSATSTGLGQVVSLWMDSHGNLFYLDQQAIVIRVIAQSSGIVFNVAGTNGVTGFSGDGGNSADSLLGKGSEHIYGDSNGNLYLGDTGNYRVRKISKDWIISTIAGTGFLSMSGDGSAASNAQMYGVKGIWVNSNLNSYITDSSNCRIRKVTVSNGNIRTVGGVGGSGIQCGYNGEDLPFSSSMLEAPYGIWGNTLGNLYFTDMSRVKKTGLSKFINVTTIAGGGTSTDFNDTSDPTSITFLQATGIWGDSNDDLYICDAAANLVWKFISSSNRLVIVAGTTKIGASGDLGPARSAQFYSPRAVWTDTRGQIYIADSGNDKIRQVLTNNIIRTFAGGGSDNCEKCPATQGSFHYPSSIIGDRRGNVFVAEFDANRIRQIYLNSTDGFYYVTTIIGSGQFGITQGLTPAASAAIASPISLAIDRKNNLYIVSSDFSMIYKASKISQPTVSPSFAPSAQPSVYFGGLAASLKQSLVAYYPFDNSPNDNSGNGHNGALHGGVYAVHDRFGSAQSAYSFDGKSGYIEIAGQDFNFINNMTISLWMYLRSIQLPLLVAYLKSENGNSNSNIYSYCLVSTNCSNNANNKLSVAFNQWNHLIFIKMNSNIKIYINNVLQLNYVFPLPIHLITNDDLIIGATKEDPTNITSPFSYFNGSIDEMFFFNRSISPSEIMTLYDFQAPTSLPSSSPSNQLSTQPSAHPTRKPSSEPTYHPTSQPSSKPSNQPSSGPSTQPTSTPPSAQPSVQPTSSPSSHPTTNPSSQPSTQPTLAPSSQLSSQPSLEPSSYPSSGPSVQPTTQPTYTQPTIQPSSPPSSFPSFRPMSEPSISPITQPSSNPSNSPFPPPSSEPSTRPSIQPSSCSTALPTSFPTAQPSESPSDKPSAPPTSQPSTQPTIQPSSRSTTQPCQPSSQPTRQPTRQPISQPTSQPLAHPTSSPTSYPSLHTKAPTVTQAPTMPSISIILSSDTPSTVLSSGRLRQVNFLFGTAKSGSAYRNVYVGKSTLQGSSYLLLGSPSLPSYIDLSLYPYPAYTSLPTEDGGITVDTASSRTIAFSGDFNGDRLSEFWLGEYTQSYAYIVFSSRQRQNSGGSQGGWVNVTDGFQLIGSSGDSSGLGWAISSAGDFNADGVEDVIISAIYSSKSYILFGTSAVNATSYSLENYLKAGGIRGITLSTKSDLSIVLFGVAVAGVGDFNRDGYDDVIVTALGTSGANILYIIYGQKVTTSTSLIVVVNGVTGVGGYNVTAIYSPIYSFAGLSLSSAGDVNGDGIKDIIIGCTPFNQGYSQQISFLLYGRVNAHLLTSLSLNNLTTTPSSSSTSSLSKLGSVVVGGGIVVMGVGDVNKDGYSDVMIVNYLSWQSGKSGSYLVIPPSTLTSNPPTLLPSSQPTHSATTAPPISPSEMPTNRPSTEPSSYDSPLPQNNTTSSKPTIARSPRPTRNPTFNPTIRPSIITTSSPSPLPSLRPKSTLSPSLAPSMSPTVRRPPTRVPSQSPQPSSQPTSAPSLGQSSQGRTVTVTSEEEVVRGSNGQETYLIEASSAVTIIGNKGAKHYIISPSTSDGVRIVIKDFDDVKGDVLDLSRWSYSTTSLSYYTAPLTFSLQPQNVSIVLSSHASYDINSTSILYPLSGSSSTTSSSSDGTSGALTNVVGLLTSSNILSAVIPLLALTILACVISNRERLTGSKKKSAREADWYQRERISASPPLLTPPPVSRSQSAVGSFPFKELLTIGEEGRNLDGSDDSFSDDSDDDSETIKEEQRNKKIVSKKKSDPDNYKIGKENAHDKEESLRIPLISSHNDLSYYSDSDKDINDDSSSSDLSSFDWSLKGEDYEYLV